MMILFSVIPATALVIIGYFVLFASTRSEGGMKRFGQYLAVWIFFLASVVVLAIVLAPVLGIQGPMGGSMMGDMGEHMQRMEQMQEEQLTILRQLQG